MKKTPHGFTLVELAVVLVIIGLLLGGVLKGQELIYNAKAKSLANDFRVVSAAYFGYLDRFRAVPGDDKTPDTHVKNGTKADAGTQNNGIIEGAWNASSTETKTESFVFWQHVRLAGLLSGSSDTSSGTYLPYNSEAGRIGITGDAANNKPISDATFGGSFWVCSGNINARLARQLDSMLDDGATNAGILRATETAGSASATLTVSEEGNSKVYIVCMGY